ncbi:MAG: T9SS type A sorting domain-containing protein [Bacteroides sp.]|nr:T9SS type A sorting domain-containing protein [Bacteroides sp.]
MKTKTWLLLLFGFACTQAIAQTDTLTWVYEFESPALNPWGIEYFEGNLWITDQASGKIFKTSPEGVLLDEITVDGASLTGITFAGDELWVVNTNKWTGSPSGESPKEAGFSLYHIDPSGGEVLDSIFLALPYLQSGGLWGLCHYQDHFYASYHGGYGPCLLKIDPLTGSWEELCCTHFMGMTTRDDAIWGIWSAGLEGGDWIASSTDGENQSMEYRLEFNATGLAFDGESLWAVDPLEKKIRQLESPDNGPYHPFPEDHAAWHTMGNNMFSGEIWSFRYAASGDTLIDEGTWTKIVEMGDTLISDPGNAFFAAIRENDRKQVFALIPGFPEVMLYDFSLEVNDTIWYELGGGLCYDQMGFWETTHYKVVLAIDSVMLETGEYRKSWTLGSENAGITNWVEGIGSIDWYGLFNPLVSDFSLCGDSYQFVCFKQDDTPLFLDNPYCETCFCDPASSIPGAGDEGRMLEVYPNPSRGEISLRLSRTLPGPCYIELYDMAGQSILSAFPFHGDCTLSLGQHPPGLYLIRLLDKNGRTLQIRKIVLQ